MAEIIVEAGLKDAFREDAARLYLAAFWPKLVRILGEERRGDIIRLAAPRLRSDRVISAYRDTGLLGVAGFKRDGVGFFDLKLADLTRVYGRWGGTWRGLLLSLLERGEKPGELLMDGICVDPDARGAGIGTRLLDAIEAEARASGATAIRLDVIDSNPRARALYDRRGFMAVGTERLGPLRHVFGFASATRMHKQIGRTP